MNVLQHLPRAAKNLRVIYLVIGIIALFVGFNHAVYTKEQQLINGTVVKLALAPRDPRALMTGDYMALNYSISNQLRHEDKEARGGYVRVKLNGQGVASYANNSTNWQAPSADEVSLQYRIRQERWGNGVKFATNAYYFQEGTAKVYEAAKYGEFRVSPKGELLLTYLLDEQLNRIISPEQEIKKL
jgi:uncharacterized membrane-anchored protein